MTANGFTQEHPEIIVFVHLLQDIGRGLADRLAEYSNSPVIVLIFHQLLPDRREVWSYLEKNLEEPLHARNSDTV